MQEKIINYIEDNFHKTSALILGFVLLIITFASIDDFIEKFSAYYLYRLFFYLLICAGWVCFWYRKRVFPRNKKGFIGIVICINAENDKQKIRIKNDFLYGLNKLASDNGLNNIVSLIHLDKYHNEFAYNILSKYSKNKTGKAEKKDFEKLKNLTNGHFFIYGNIKERQDGVNKYFIDLDAMVIHSPIDVLTQRNLTQEFLKVWFKQVSFEEKFEFKGFEFTADSVFIAIEYVVGLAALVSGDVTLALNLHTKLANNAYFQKFHPLPPTLKQVKEKLKKLLAEEKLLLATKYYYENRLEESNKFLLDSMAIEINYGALLLKAIIEFLLENDPEKALKTIYDARAHSKDNSTWRYSEVFLLMYLERFEQGLRSLKKITTSSFKREEITLLDVNSFIKRQLKKEPDKFQLYFLLGYLKYRKEMNYPEAYGYFEEFKKHADTNKHKCLLQKANAYLKELEHKMSLKSIS